METFVPFEVKSVCFLMHIVMSFLRLSLNRDRVCHNGLPGTLLMKLIPLSYVAKLCKNSLHSFSCPVITASLLSFEVNNFIISFVSVFP